MHLNTHEHNTHLDPDVVLQPEDDRTSLLPPKLFAALLAAHRCAAAALRLYRRSGSTLHIVISLYTLQFLYMMVNWTGKECSSLM